MIRVPLTFHSPEVAYEFLENKFGPLHMLVKKGHALVTFEQAESNEAALNGSQKIFIVRGQPLRLFPYADGDLDAPPPVPNAESSLMTSMEPEPAAPSTAISPSISSETAKMVDEAITVLDPTDSLEVSTKRHFKEVIEYVAKFTPLYNTAKNRSRELLAGEGERTAQELLKAH
jgi:hypothetical protein